MSSGNQQHFTSANIDMLNRIIERAGTGSLLDSSDREVRMKAARFLIETFQLGVTSESALYFALLSRPDDLPEPSLADAGAHPASSSTLEVKLPRPQPGARQEGSRFGRRVENNGTWTIYHVFSGEPARYGTWNLAGLNVRTADRALRALNTPLKAS